MRGILIAAALVLPIVALPTALAVPGDGMPGASWFGLCTAYAANETGRENGNAGNAGPFAWLADQAEEADQTVEEWCAENAPHPGGNGGRGRP